MAGSDLRLFTSESVTEGHPDKMCDAISDTVLDALLADEPALLEDGNAPWSGFRSA